MQPKRASDMAAPAVAGLATRSVGQVKCSASISAVPPNMTTLPAGAPHEVNWRKGWTDMPSGPVALRTAESVIGTGEGWLTELSTSELRELFALRKEAVAR